MGMDGVLSIDGYDSRMKGWYMTLIFLLNST